MTRLGAARCRRIGGLDVRLGRLPYGRNRAAWLRSATSARANGKRTHDRRSTRDGGRDEPASTAVPFGTATPKVRVSSSEADEPERDLSSGGLCCLSVVKKLEVKAGGGSAGAGGAALPRGSGLMSIASER